MKMLQSRLLWTVDGLICVPLVSDLMALLDILTFQRVFPELDVSLICYTEFPRPTTDALKKWNKHGNILGGFLALGGKPEPTGAANAEEPTSSSSSSGQKAFSYHPGPFYVIGLTLQADCSPVELFIFSPLL